MDIPPEEQEDLYQALYNCNQSLPEDSRFVVPFICVSAVPCGWLYKENLEDVATVTDTFKALLNCVKTNQVAIPVVKFALRIAGCPCDRIEQIEGASILEASLQSNYDDECQAFDHEISRGLRFHELLIDIINDLTPGMKRHVISMGSCHLMINPSCTEMLHVHFLKLIQANIIGQNDVTKLYRWFTSRDDILDRIDKYCNQIGVPILPRQAIQHPMERPLTDDLCPQQRQAINRACEHNMDCHIVEQDGSNQDRTELEACAQSGDHNGRKDGMQPHPIIERQTPADCRFSTRSMIMGYTDKEMKDQGVQTECKMKDQGVQMECKMKDQCVQMECKMKDQGVQMEQGYHVPKPTLKELLKVKVENWYNLGLVLDIDDNDLHKIESNRPQDQDGCMRDMFRAWLRMNPQASYSQLVQSLVELGDLTEADRLCRKYGIDMPSRPRSQ